MPAARPHYGASPGAPPEASPPALSSCLTASSSSRRSCTAVSPYRVRRPVQPQRHGLDLPTGEPVIELRRTTRTADGRVVEYARGVHAASRFMWSYTFVIPD
ncbi:UTRA domain-containing protein [Nonomuraea glycinis]|nr:UTRA domain-containing protein [Nonomuraea glycinis]